MDGVVVIDKPAGLTSHDVVAHARRALRVRRIGHIGTLDPMATGVLPLVVGRATRLASLVATGPKVYDGRILLGVTTDTYDITGTVVADARDRTATELVRTVPRSTVEEALRGFVGTFDQRPPAYSAKKIGGVRAYRLARRQQPVEPPPVQVTVHAITVLSVDGAHVRCRVRCEPGFYMRSLAHELGSVLGCGGCLEALRREQSGQFGVEQAITLEQLASGSEATARMVPMSELLPHLPRLLLTPRGVQRVSHGNDLTRADVILTQGTWPEPGPPHPETPSGSPRRLDDAPCPSGGTAPGQRPVVQLCDEDGRLVAIASAESPRILHPTIVLV